MLLFLSCTYHNANLPMEETIEQTDASLPKDSNCIDDNMLNPTETVTETVSETASSNPSQHHHLPPPHPLECIYQLFSQDTIATYMTSMADVPSVANENGTETGTGAGTDSNIKGLDDDVEEEEKEEEKEN